MKSIIQIKSTKSKSERKLEHFKPEQTQTLIVTIHDILKSHK